MQATACHGSSGIPGMAGKSYPGASTVPCRVPEPKYGSGTRTDSPMKARTGTSGAGAQRSDGAGTYCSPHGSGRAGMTECRSQEGVLQ
jgi:hypothetical protein